MPEKSTLDERLPSGRHGIDPALVAENQRWRVISAAAQVFAEEGYSALTTRSVCARAHVSTSAFYRDFADLDACLLVGSEVAAGMVGELVSDACRSGQPEETRLRVALTAAVEFVATEPGFASLLGPQARAAVPAVCFTRTALLERLADLLPLRRDLARLFLPGLAAVLAGPAPRAWRRASLVAELLSLLRVPLSFSGAGLPPRTPPRRR